MSWVYGEDIARGCILALDKGVSGERYMLDGRPEDVVSIANACNRMGQLAGIDHEVVDIEPSDDPELAKVFGPTLVAIAEKAAKARPDRRKLEDSKTYKRLGYSPISLDEGLATTLELVQGRSASSTTGRGHGPRGPTGRLGRSQSGHHSRGATRSFPIFIHSSVRWFLQVHSGPTRPSASMPVASCTRCESPAAPVPRTGRDQIGHVICVADCAEAVDLTPSFAKQPPGVARQPGGRRPMHPAPRGRETEPCRSVPNWSAAANLHPGEGAERRGHGFRRGRELNETSANNACRLSFLVGPAAGPGITFRFEEGTWPRSRQRSTNQPSCSAWTGPGSSSARSASIA